MAQNALRDENRIPVMLFVGSDGGTYYVKGDEVTGRLYVDVPSGSGDVVGPASSVNENIAVFDGITGKLIKDGAKKISELQLALGYTAENVANKRTAFQVTPDDTAYPSEKLVKDSLDAKAPLTSPTFGTSITGSYLTASEMLITDADKKIVSAAVDTYPSLTELSYVKGVTSGIQTQIGALVPKSLFDAHSILYATTDDTPVALTIPEQTIVGRKTGGNIEALAIDSDLSSVSANDDTVPSAKATKDYADAKVEDNITDGVTTKAPSQNAVFDALATKSNLTQIREKLTGNRTYYVRTDGNDSNNGLTNDTSGAFLTIQKAIDTAASLDLSIYNITIQVGNGTYTGGNTLKSCVGSGFVLIIGDTTTPSNVVVSTTSANCFYGSNVTTTYQIAGIKMQTTTSGRCLHADSKTAIEFYSCDFGAAANSHIIATGFGSSVKCSGNYSISGGTTSAHLQSTSGGYIAISGRTVTISGTPAFGNFAVTDRGSCLIEAFSCTFSGSATGKRYTSINNSVIFVNGAAADYFPGNSAGSVSNGGLYV